MRLQIQIGARGFDIAKIQSYLNLIRVDNPLIPQLEIDGVYGPVTSIAVRIFQRSVGLIPTGCFDEATWNRCLYQIKKQSCFSTQQITIKPLNESLNALTIYKFQQYLNKLVHEVPLLETSNLDSKMREKIILFQKRYCLSIDGTLNNETWDKIIQMI